MTPQEKAWERYHEVGLTTAEPIGLMNAVLDAYAENHTLKEAVMAFVKAAPDSEERILTFGAMVKELAR